MTRDQQIRYALYTPDSTGLWHRLEWWGYRGPATAMGRDIGWYHPWLVARGHQTVLPVTATLDTLLAIDRRVTVHERYIGPRLRVNFYGEAA